MSAQKLSKKKTIAEDDEQLEIEEDQNLIKPQSSFSKNVPVPAEEIIQTSCCWRLCCCCYYLFCCCCCESGGIKITKNKFISRFEKWLNLGHQNQRSTDPLTLLIRLYAHDRNAIKDLEKVRVNPDFTSKFRNDLEFYIPQLCSFYLKGETEQPQEIINLIVAASTSSFFFSHRIWFYFKSMIFGDDQSSKEQFKRARVALKGLKDSCIQQKERLYLTNSKDLIELIIEFGLIEYYFQLNEILQMKGIKSKKNIEEQKTDDKSSENNEFIKRIQKVRHVIDEYCENGSQTLYKLTSTTGKESINESFSFDSEQQKINIHKKIPEDIPQIQVETQNADSDGGVVEDIMITAKDIILIPYTRDTEISYRDMIWYSNRQTAPGIQDKDHALNTYLSTPKFIMNLTDISLELIDQPNREEYLKQELKKINKSLPASVYLPFVNDSMRNYAILHIVTDEAKVFQTKERAPLLLCLEAFRPEELMFQRPQKLSMKRKKSQIKQGMPNQELEYVNYRSQSWSSHQVSQDSDMIVPLIGSSKKNSILNNQVPMNPYQQDNSSKPRRGTLKETKDANKQVFASGGDIAAKVNKNTQRNQEKELMKLAAEKNKKNKEELKTKANKLFDEKASGPLTITNQKRRDSLFNNIKLDENYFNTYLKQASEQFERTHQNHMLPILEEIDEADQEVGQTKKREQSANSLYFKTLDGSLKDESKLKRTTYEFDNNFIKIEERKEEEDDQMVEEDDIGSRQFNYSRERRSQSVAVPLIQSETNKGILYDDKDRIEEEPEEAMIRPTLDPKDFYDQRPANTIFLETSKEQDERVRKNSPFGHLKTWKLIKIIVKSNDDVRQEQFAMQLIFQMNQIFHLKKLNLWLKPYEILATGARCGLIEMVSDALSIDAIKKKMGQTTKLVDYFYTQFGDRKSKKFKKARNNFCSSLAAYSLVCYILQIKDRHNGNILVDIEGHIMHIDFGFLLSNAPGKGLKFEQAPFKLTAEMVEVLGGIKSKKFRQFRELMRLGYMAIQEYADKVIKLVEMMFMGQNDLPCFILGEDLIAQLKTRILPKGQPMTEVECAKHVDQLILDSFDNWRTKAYDKFQYCCQGIL